MKIEDLAREVSAQLAKYVDVIDEDIDNAVQETADNAADELRQTSPKNTGDYATGWKVKTPSSGKNRGHRTVYNAKHYQLTHLLEFGHAKRSGGRTKAQPHIAQARDNAAKKLEAAILAAVERRENG